jgi:outer membrane lipoprotein LolB
MAPRLALAWSLVLLALAGCRTAPPPAPIIGPGADAPWEQQEAALRKLDRYSQSGRVAVAAGDQGFSGTFRYQQQPDRADLAIDGPLGMGGVRVAIEGEEISIATGRGEKYDGNAAREELERRLGFALPMHQLRWWLLGLPEARAEPVDVILASETVGPVGFEQDGWKVTVQARAPAMGFALPQRLTIEREGARLKLLVDQWQP